MNNIKEDSRPAVMVFGAGTLQGSLLRNAREMGLRTVAIDPNPQAEATGEADEFLVIGPQDFEATVEAARSRGVNGVITAGTDKPVVMMARVAEALGLPSIAVADALASTNKAVMKRRFRDNAIDCAHGVEVSSPQEVAATDIPYPLVIKPVDNSGSRGVLLCPDEAFMRRAWAQTVANTRHPRVLVEEMMHGREFSVETVHLPNGETHVIQITEKIMSAPPYSVEHRLIEPAGITLEEWQGIVDTVTAVGRAFNFHNCGSHTEVKLYPSGRIQVIETSPRLGGDCISTTLVPTSTGVNIEKLILKLCLGQTPTTEELTPTRNHQAVILFFHHEPGSRVERRPDEIAALPGVMDFSFRLNPGDTIPEITGGPSHYAHTIVEAPDRPTLMKRLYEVETAAGLPHLPTHSDCAL